MFRITSGGNGKVIVCYRTFIGIGIVPSSLDVNLITVACTGIGQT